MATAATPCNGFSGSVSRSNQRLMSLTAASTPMISQSGFVRCHYQKDPPALC
jgi:hypothetical protein